MMESSTPASESGAPTRKIVGTAPQSGAASRISPRRSAITIPMRQPPPRTSTDAVAAPATPNRGKGPRPEMSSGSSPIDSSTEAVRIRRSEERRVGKGGKAGVAAEEWEEQTGDARE